MSLNKAKLDTAKPASKARSNLAPSLRGSLILGVDPGLTGAIAFYDFTTSILVAVYDMPLTKMGKKNFIDIFKLATTIELHAKDVELAVIEEVGSRPAQSSVSTFTFGYVSGIATGVIGAQYIPITLVKPQIWKSLAGLSRDKSKSIELAEKNFPLDTHPHLKGVWKGPRDGQKDGRAEAALLAQFGARYV